jgi:starch-binding outer membrane protein, SusD/RagB family
LKIMKLNKYCSLIIVGLMMIVSSCDIDRIPEDRVSDPVFWRTESDLRNASNYLYKMLPGFYYNFDINNPGLILTNRTPIVEDTFADDAIGTAISPISDGSRVAVPVTDFEFSFFYMMVRAANNIIEKAPNALQFNLTQPIVDRYVAEARFFRAYAYYELFKRYGTVVLITKPIDETAPENTAPQNATRDQLTDLMYGDLDFAATKLPATIVAAENGRASQTAALALKARIALFEGTRAKFHGYGDPTKHLNLAITAAQDVVTRNIHSLSNNYFNLFQTEFAGGATRPEAIFTKQYLPGTIDANQAHSYFRNVLENGQMVPTKNLADSYLMRDGLPKEISKNYKTPTTNLAMFGDTSRATGRDWRLSATYFKRNDPWINNGIYTTPNVGLSRTGLYFRKYAVPADWVSQQSGLDRVLIRYAEVLLTLAEAKYELNNSISDADLDATINQLRPRAGLPKLTNAFVTTNLLNMRNEIRRERRVELAQEGFRYWDLLRWKTAEIELPKALYGIIKFAELGNVTTPSDPANENALIAQAASSRRFNPARDYLWPIPLQEFNIDGTDGTITLKQNPGW